jgi:hypothetical protein
LLFFAYLIQVNHAATLGYRMRSVEKDIERLRLENEHVAFQASELQSVERIHHRLQMLDLDPVEEVSYLTVGGAAGSVALR